MRSLFLFYVCIGLVACGGSDDSGGTTVDQGIQADAVVPDSQVVVDAAPDDVGLAQLELAESEIAFGVTGVGGQERRDVGIINSGTVDLEIVEIEGLSAPFSVNRNLPARIPAGARRTFVFVFEPTDVGTFEQDVILATNVAGVSATLSLSGSVETTDGRLVSSEINFGLQQPGQSKSEFIRLENLSESSAITISQVSGIDAPFSVAPGQIPATAAPGERAQVLLNFSPVMDGEYRQTITIRTNAGDFEAQLIGRASAPGSLEVTRVKPTWAPIDEVSTLTIYGGPFPADGTFTASVAGQPLEDVERIDERHIRATLPAMPMAETGVVDVRVENGSAFGLLIGRFILTGPVAEGMTSD
ncbi:MAG: choice-of-anchor D domain-containing protein [Myxococcota bacterium]|nr:choice-of-anchor D domain-containing protein [Myxococcota bacterium]